MPLTAQQVADALNAAGMDTPEKFAGFLGQAGPLVERNALLSQVDKLRVDQAAAAKAIQDQIQVLLDRIAALDEGMRG